MSEQPSRRFPRGVLGAYIVSVIAIVLSMGTGAYAAVHLGKGVVHTRNIAKGAVTNPKLAKNAVSSKKVKNHALRLHDLGGVLNAKRTVTGADLTIPPNQCRQVELDTINPAPKALVGSLVVTYVTTRAGGPVLDNLGFMVPTVTSETSQGGVIPNAMVCAGGSTQTVPAGSVYHYTLIGQ